MIRNIIVLVLGIAGSSSAFADLFVSRDANGVDRYSNDGAFLGNVVAPGAGGLGQAQGVAIASNGDLLVGDFTNGNILRFNSAGVFQGVFASDPDIDTPFDVVFGPDGKLYVASAGPTSNIAQVDPVTGAVLNGSFTSGNVTPIGGPQYLEFGPSLAVTDIAGHLFLFNPATGTHIANIGPLDNPEGVAFNQAGDLFVAQRISNNVLRFPSGGGPAEIVIPMGAFDGAPADIEFGPNGLLYVSADKIYRFDVSGPAGVLVDSFGTGGEFLVFSNPVPEPGTYVMALVALAGLGVRRFRRC